MMSVDKPTSSTRDALTLEELIRSELQGKSQAIGRYDDILWKIRSGYVAILYGALSLLGKETLGSPSLTLLMIYGFSVCAFVVDYSFLRSKLRVVVAKDRLVDVAQQLIAGTEATSLQDIPALLHISGENPTFPFESDVQGVLWHWKGAWRVLVLYAVTPIIGTVALVLLAVGQ
jgi:hypothetical protein